MALLHSQGKLTDEQWEHFKKIEPKKKAKNRKKRANSG